MPILWKTPGEVSEPFWPVRGVSVGAQDADRAARVLPVQRVLRMVDGAAQPAPQIPEGSMTDEQTNECIAWVLAGLCLVGLAWAAAEAGRMALELVRAVTQ